MNIKEIVDKLQKAEDVYMIFNVNSIVPYVCCDTEDTMLDYASLYFDEEKAVAKAKELTDEGLGTKRAMKISNKSILALLTDTLYYGIDAIKFYTDDGDIIIETDQMVRLDKDARGKDGKPYLSNRSAQISMIYLVQELLKDPKGGKQDPKRTAAAQTEVLANIVNSPFYIAFTEMKPETEADGNADAAKAADKKNDTPDGKKFAPALLKDKAGKLMLPVFTDINELRKAFRGAPDQTVPYKAFKFRTIVEQLLPEGSNLDGIIINPAGVKLPMLNKAIHGLVKDPRFIEPEDEQTAAAPGEN